MINNIVYALSGLFSTIGIISVISIIIIKLMKPGRKTTIYVVTVFDKNEKTPDVRMSKIVSFLSLAGLYRRTRIIAADDGMEKEAAQRLYNAFHREKNIKILNKNDISGNIFKK